MGGNSFSETEATLQGEWDEEDIILGFHVDGDAARMRLPHAHIAGGGTQLLDMRNTEDPPKPTGAYAVYPRYTDCNGLRGPFARQ